VLPCLKWKVIVRPLQTALCIKYIHYTITFSLDKMFGWYAMEFYHVTVDFMTTSYVLNIKLSEIQYKVFFWRLKFFTNWYLITMCSLRLQYCFFCTYKDIQKESYTITNINVWQLFPIHLTFSYQNVKKMSS
jgi:hypothetical protein